MCSQAPGKIILFGEHFVVKGCPALVTAVNLYAKTCIEERIDSKHYLYSKQLNKRVDLDSDQTDEWATSFRTIYRIISEQYGKPEGFNAILDSEIPMAAGMGSSAATAVSFTHALLSFIGYKPNKERVNKIAFEAEKIVHVKPSGVDNTIAVYGGLIYYKKGEIKQLNIEWPEKYSLIVVNTGIKRNTGLVVKEVLEGYNRNPEIMEKIYEAASLITEKALEHLMNKNYERLGELININHGLLVAIGVSILETELLVHKLLSLGALGAKISGAGRGGIVYGLVKREQVGEMIRTIKDMGYNAYGLQPVKEGVREI
ncbi:MAG: mevalonate kinase [Staphylothermus sp.]|nr:mevalonate kinase [Staphylothermus sp.]